MGSYPRKKATQRSRKRSSGPPIVHHATSHGRTHMATRPASQSPNCVRASRPSFDATRDKADRIGEGVAVWLGKDGGELGVWCVLCPRCNSTHRICSSSPATRAANAFSLHAQMRDSSSWLIHAVPAPSPLPRAVGSACRFYILTRVLINDLATCLQTIEDRIVRPYLFAGLGGIDAARTDRLEGPEIRYRDFSDLTAGA
jgi:hypothetical protein